MNDQAIEQEIQAKGLTAPRITPEDIEANIVSENYFTAEQGALAAEADALGWEKVIASVNVPAELGLITFCVLTMRNGHKIVGVNTGPVSAANFDAELGRKLARKNATDQVWPLLGFALRERLIALA